MSDEKKLPPAEKYHIEFNTEHGPGILATAVELRSEYIQDMQAKLRIDLVDHPLYPKLEQYVLSNPSGKFGWGRKRTWR